MVVRLIVRATAATRDVISRGACTRGSGSSWQQKQPITNHSTTVVTEEGNTIWSCSPICKRSVAQQNSYKGIHVRTLECFFGMPPIATISTIFLTRPNMSSIPFLSFNLNLLLVRASRQRFDLKGFGSEILGYALRWVSLMEWDPVKRHVTTSSDRPFLCSKQVWGWESESQQLDIQYHWRGCEGSRCKSLFARGLNGNCLRIHVPCLYTEPNRGTHTFENSFETDRNTDTACRSVMCLAMMLFTADLLYLFYDRQR